MTTNDNTPNPRRGEVWRVNFDPTEGSEIDKTRPAIVISSDAIGVLPVRLVVPVTGWKSWYEGQTWHVRLRPTKQNGLSKDSAADALQTRSVATSRFIHRMGRVSTTELENIVTALAVVIEYE